MEYEKTVYLEKRVTESEKNAAKKNAPYKRKQNLEQALLQLGIPVVLKPPRDEGKLNAPLRLFNVKLLNECLCRKTLQSYSRS